jgi:hypothetical protein
MFLFSDAVNGGGCMSKLDNNERWKTKMIMTEHVEQYEDSSVRTQIK